MTSIINRGTFFVAGLITIIWCGFFTVALAADYVPLVNIPAVANPNNINDYINALYNLSISIAALIAVVKIVIAGAKWMFGSTSISSIQSAKQDIQNALIGLLIIIGAVLILNTINSDLTNLTIFDESDRIVVNDTQTSGVFVTMDQIKAACEENPEAMDCSTEIRCNDNDIGNFIFGSAFWGNMEYITNPNDISLSCGVICKNIGGYMDYGLAIDGTDAKCHISKTLMNNLISDYFEKLVTDQCSSGRVGGEICQIELCSEHDLNNNTYNGNSQQDFSRCEAECLEERQGSYFDTRSGACIFTGDYYLTEKECSERVHMTWSDEENVCYDQTTTQSIACDFFESTGTYDCSIARGECIDNTDVPGTPVTAADGRSIYCVQ